jgi:hypothetical protein
VLNHNDIHYALMYVLYIVYLKTFLLYIHQHFVTQIRCIFEKFFIINASALHNPKSGNAQIPIVLLALNVNNTFDCLLLLLVQPLVLVVFFVHLILNAIHQLMLKYITLP